MNKENILKELNKIGKAGAILLELFGVDCMFDYSYECSNYAKSTKPLHEEQNIDYGNKIIDVIDRGLEILGETHTYGS